MAQPALANLALTLAQSVLDAQTLVRMRDQLRVRGISDEEFGLRLIRAALLDYKALVLETGLLSRADEINQRRVLLLMECVYQGLPGDADLAAALRIKLSSARSLTNAIAARFPERVHDLLVVDARRTLAEVDTSSAREQDIFIWSDATAQLIRDTIDELNFEQAQTARSNRNKQVEYYAGIKWKEGFRRRYSISPLTARKVLDRLNPPEP